MYKNLLQEEIQKMESEYDPEIFKSGKYEEAQEILNKLILSGEFPEFLTSIAYDKLE